MSFISKPKIKKNIFWRYASFVALIFFYLASPAGATEKDRVERENNTSPQIVFPMPATYKLLGDKLVCEKEKDHPKKSNKNKKRHLDMECCLDPDEIPNPHCYYPPEKYGKFLGLNMKNK